MTLSEPHGRYKDHSITEQGCPNVMMAISVSPAQSSDSGGICVIGVQVFPPAHRSDSELPRSGLWFLSFSP